MEQTERMAIRCSGITKTFGEVVANDQIELSVRFGEVLALLGENGSGKTTLMNMLSGIYHPDAGKIYVEEKPVSINSPADAQALGIGMIHQHFKLVDVFTAAENIVLGLEDEGKLDLKAASARITDICQKYGFVIDPGNAGKPQIGQLGKAVRLKHDVVRLDGHFDMVTVAGQRFVDGVVHDLVHQMVQAPRAGGADVHTGALAHSLQALQNLNFAAGVLMVGSGAAVFQNFFCHFFLQCLLKQKSVSDQLIVWALPPSFGHWLPRRKGGGAAFIKAPAFWRGPPGRRC